MGKCMRAWNIVHIFEAIPAVCFCLINFPFVQFSANRHAALRPHWNVNRMSHSLTEISPPKLFKFPHIKIIKWSAFGGMGPFHMAKIDSCWASDGARVLTKKTAQKEGAREFLIWNVVLWLFHQTVFHRLWPIIFIYWPIKIYRFEFEKPFAAQKTKNGETEWKQ